jgi:hypothetical protein
MAHSVVFWADESGVCNLAAFAFASNIDWIDSERCIDFCHRVDYDWSKFQSEFLSFLQFIRFLVFLYA